jgi:hypothetical protein
MMLYLIEDAIEEIIPEEIPYMNNWKTTTFAILASIATLIIQVPNHFGLPSWVMEVANWVQAGGLAGLGIFAADKVKK